MRFLVKNIKAYFIIVTLIAIGVVAGIMVCAESVKIYGNKIQDIKVVEEAYNDIILISENDSDYHYHKYGCERFDTEQPDADVNVFWESVGRFQVSYWRDGEQFIKTNKDYNACEICKNYKFSDLSSDDREGFYNYIECLIRKPGDGDEITDNTYPAGNEYGEDENNDMAESSDLAPEELFHRIDCKYIRDKQHSDLLLGKAYGPYPVAHWYGLALCPECFK